MPVLGAAEKDATDTKTQLSKTICRCRHFEAAIVDDQYASLGIIDLHLVGAVVPEDWMVSHIFHVTAFRDSIFFRILADVTRSGETERTLRSHFLAQSDPRRTIHLTRRWPLRGRSAGLLWDLSWEDKGKERQGLTVAYA